MIGIFIAASFLSVSKVSMLTSFCLEDTLIGRILTGMRIPLMLSDYYEGLLAF